MDNKWNLLYAGPGTPGGYAIACCYETKRNVIWAYGHESRLSRFDLKTKTWSVHTIRPAIDYLGLYNFHMQYLPRNDKILLVGNDTCTIDLKTLVSHHHPLENSSSRPRASPICLTRTPRSTFRCRAVKPARSIGWRPSTASRHNGRRSTVKGLPLVAGCGTGYTMIRWTTSSCWWWIRAYGPTSRPRRFPLAVVAERWPLSVSDVLPIVLCPVVILPSRVSPSWKSDNRLFIHHARGILPC